LVGGVCCIQRRERDAVEGVPGGAAASVDDGESDSCVTEQTGSIIGCARAREEERSRERKARLIHATKIDVEWRRYHGVPVTNSCTMTMTLAQEDEGKWRGEMGVEEGADGSYTGALDVRGKWGDGRGAVPGEKRKEGRLEVGGGTDKGGPPVRKKREGGYLFGMEIDGPLNLDRDGLRSPKFLFSFFFLLLFFSVFIFPLYLLQYDFKSSQTNV
jgi:hypothetical protein